MCFPDLMTLKGFIKGITKGKLPKVQGVYLFYSFLKFFFCIYSNLLPYVKPLMIKKLNS